MGTSPLQASATGLNDSLVRLLQPPKAADNQPPAKAQGPPARDNVSSSAAFFSRSQELTLSAKLEQIVAQLQTEEDGTESGVGFKQLNFDFFAEAKSTEIAAFQERTQRVADGLEGTHQSRFSAVSKEVSFKFEFSLSLSAASLDGFANAAEGLSDIEELFGQLLDTVEKLLQKADELFNGFFESFSGEAGGFNISELFSKALEGLKPENLLQALEGFGGGQGGAGASASAVQLEFNFSFSASASSTTVEVEQSDPIVLDLDGDGIELTSYKNGAAFDILGNGGVQNTAFVTGGDAFLALDRNVNGKIDSGKELFGDQNGARNGYEELRKLDANGDGKIDVNDPAYKDLVLFRDNGNGKTEKGELISLAEAGIAEISLRYKDIDELTSGGNRLAQTGFFTRDDGTRGRAADAILNYTA
jgi:hypothetical protein